MCSHPACCSRCTRVLCSSCTSTHAALNTGRIQDTSIQMSSHVLRVQELAGEGLRDMAECFSGSDNVDLVWDVEVRTFGQQLGYSDQISEDHDHGRRSRHRHSASRPITASAYWVRVTKQTWPFAFESQ